MKQENSGYCGQNKTTPEQARNCSDLAMSVGKGFGENWIYRRLLTRHRSLVMGFR